MAATPDTIGAANDVPSPWAYWLPGKVETMLKPGAARSSQSPKELKSTSLPASSVAPTANTSGKAAGYWGTSLPVLPAAATTTTLRAVAYWTAACSSGLNPAPPRDRLITRAPWSTASTMPVATSESKARSPANTLTGMTRPFQVTPATPMPLFALAAITPATNVPCPGSSVIGEAGATTLNPGARRPTRSGWVTSTPVSTTATTCDVASVIRSHAAGIRIVFR